MSQLTDLKIRKIHISKKLIAIIIAIMCVVTIVASMALRAHNGNDSDEVTYTTATAEKNDMKVTLTAAGEIVGAENDTIDFSTSKTFDGMCVEENESVTKGQQLIKYTDGTYEIAAHDGVITYINPPKAGSVADDTNSITLSRTNKLSLEITVPEDQINQIKKGSGAVVVVNSDTAKTFEGKITGKKAMSTTLISDKSSDSSSSGSSSDMSSVMDGSDKSDPFGSESSASYYTVSLEFSNDGTLLPGMSASCVVTLSEREDVLTVPVEGVYFTSEGKAYVYEGNVKNAEETEVEIGDSDANNVEISKGLKAGDTIRVEEQK